MNPKLVEESPPSSSHEDNNANLNNRQNKGAIPKTKNYLQSNSKQKNVKINNNVEVSDHFKSHHHINSVKTQPNNFDFDENSLNSLRTSSDFILSVSLKSVHLDDTSSSSENEFSTSDDGCIYTYKGDSDAELPGAFFEPPILENIDAQDENHRDGTASPEMDFLEMDFDPGPSGDADSISSNPSQENELPFDNNTLYESNQNNSIDQNDRAESINRENIFEKIESKTEKNKKSVIQMEEIRMPWSNYTQRTKGSERLRTVRRHMNSYGDLTPTEYKIMAQLHRNEKEEDEKIMIWNEEEAILKQITQIGPSSCGATAVLNVLTALRLPLPSLDLIKDYVPTNLRLNSAPLTDYLKSRSKAGCTHREIINGLNKASNGKIYARFFAMYPERELNLNKWLYFWIKNGGIPVATLNLQKCDGSIPDSWHHQTIFGVDSQYVYLTNPMEQIEAGELWHQLCSESILLIRREDVVNRWNPRCDIIELGKIKDRKWTNLNVLGQVAKIIREKPRELRENSTITSHIKIPADYKSGITIAVDKNSNTAIYQLLKECPELPLLKFDSTTSN